MTFTKKIEVSDMEGNRKRTPIPKRDVEREATKSSPVVTYTVSPEEMKEMVKKPSAVESKARKPSESNELKETDQVNHPAHYTAGEVECIEAIESAVTGLTGMEAYCTGNAIKYLWRWKLKNGKEDLQKAGWYVDRMIESK